MRDVCLVSQRGQTLNIPQRAGWPRVIAHPGLPQIRTCRITASGSSNDNFASHTITRRESGLLSAGVASTWNPSSVPPPRVLPAGLSLDAPLPSTGSFRTSSPTSTVLSGRYDFLPPIPPHFVFLRLAVPREHSLFRSRRRRVLRRRAWGWSPGIPGRDCFRGDDRVSQVPGEPPLCLCPALRPRQANVSGHYDTPTRPPL